MVSVLAFYSDDPSSIPAEVYNFFCKNIVEKNENKQKEAGVGPFFLKKNSRRIKLRFANLDRPDWLFNISSQSGYTKPA